MACLAATTAEAISPPSALPPHARCRIVLSCKSRSNRPGREGTMVWLGRLFAAIAVTHAFGLVPTQAQTNYPERPVKIIVPIGPGGSYDLVGRALADALSKRT